jgi:Uma2 family endonuclease
MTLPTTHDTTTEHLPYDPDFYDEHGVFYPDTDGEGMPEGDAQLNYVAYSILALRRYFKDAPDVYVSGNLFIYYEKGKPSASVAPDLFVIFGVDKRFRFSYMLWREGKLPDIAVEITSKATKAKDKRDKLALYQRLGVREYFQYDPTGEYLHPPLRGYRLNDQGRYQELPGQWRPDGILALESTVLALELHLDGERLRMFDPARGDYLRSYDEAEEQLAAEQRARQHAEQARQHAETRASEELRARQHAETRASEELRARQHAEAEVAALRAELERLRSAQGPETN